MFNSEFYVNVDAVIAASERIGTTFSRLSGMIESQMLSVVKQILVDEFQTAARYANSDGGFPERFQEHLLEVVGRIVPTVIMDGDSLFVNLDLEEWLGGREQLKRAFHQGAQLAEGGKLWGPYTGQALKNDDAAERHQFWEALQRGDRKVDVDGKSVHIKEGAWDETIDQYINIWGEQAPQWLFIQFGQEEWAPYVPQYDIYGTIRERVADFAGTYLATLLEREVAIANAYRSTGLEVGFTGQKGPARVLAGDITVNGKRYRPGRFAPRGGIG